MTEPSDDRSFAVFAEVKDHEKPLIQYPLTFASLIDDIVYPFESKDPFYLDGIRVKRDDIKRIKILDLTREFDSKIHRLHHKMSQGDVERMRVLGEQYSIRVEAILRENSRDVTAQVLKAFSQSIESKLKDYIPNRQSVITASWKLFELALRFTGQDN